MRACSFAQAITSSLDATPNLKHRAMIATMYSCGLRVSEVTHLHYDDISRTNKTIHIRDGKSRFDRYTLLLTREFDTFPNEKQRISCMNAYIFLSNFLFLYIGFFGFLCYNGIEVKKLKVNTSKSKNAESFYIKTTNLTKK